MKGLPKEITAYLVTHALEKRNPAYLLIGRNTILKEFGGDTALYGIGSLRRGESALDQVPFLEGLLPLRQSSLILPCVQIDTGRKVDVHIISDGSRHWVLLLSIIDEEIEHLHLLEKASEHNTVHERHTKILDQYLGMLDTVGKKLSVFFPGFILKEIPKPDQLYAPELPPHDYDRLAVAYGLSFSVNEIGEIIPESEVADISRREWKEMGIWMRFSIPSTMESSTL